MTHVLLVLAGLAVGVLATYLICRYSKSIKSAAGIGGTSLAAVAGITGLAVFYNGEPVEDITLHSEMVPIAANDMHYSAGDVPVDSGDLFFQINAKIDRTGADSGKKTMWIDSTIADEKTHAIRPKWTRLKR